MKKSIGIFCLILLALIVAPTAATTWHLHDGDNINDYTEISGSVDTQPGDTIFLYSGTYHIFTVQKPHLSIIGEGADVVFIDGMEDQEIYIVADAGRYDVNGTRIEGVSVINTGAGLYTKSCSDLVVTNCVFEGVKEECGIDISATNVTFTHNVVKNSTGIYSAVFLRDSNNCTVAHNTFINNTGADVTCQGSNNIITKNTFISSSTAGIEFYESGGDNIVYLNEFIDNAADVISTGTTTTQIWNSTAPISYTYNGATHTGYLGNSWSDYTGADENGDGVGETAYEVPQGLGTDYAPLTAAASAYTPPPPELTTIVVSPAKAEVAAGSTQQFSAAGFDQYGDPVADLAFTWACKHPAVGTVDENGLFTAKESGVAVVTAAADGVRGVAVVEVPGAGKALLVDDDGGEGVYTNIGDAVAAAVEGDTIFVRAGIYPAFYDLTIPNLTITGEGADLVTVDCNGDSLAIRDTGTTLEGLSVLKASTVKVYGQDCIIRDCVFDELKASYGFDINADNTTFTDNTVKNCTANYGIRLKSNNTEFRNNIIKDSTTPYGALAVWEIKNGVFENNTIINNTGAAALIYHATNCSFERNIFSENPDGILVYEAGDGHKFVLNSFKNTTIVKAWGWTGDFTAAMNSTAPITYTYNGATHTGYLGNSWSDYTGTDENGDGVGETPYVLPDGLGTDYAPLTAAAGGYEIVVPTLTTIAVDSEAFEFETGETWQFAATGFYQDGTEISGTLDCTWSSSDESVGTVNETGWFEAVAPGTATLTAACEGVEGTADVTIVAPETLPSIEIIRYAPDGVTVEEEKTVTIRWMQRHLPVLGGENGTMLRFQGPTFVEGNLWDPEETVNLDKINNTVKGTALADLCTLVGGVYDGGEIQFIGRDYFPGKLPSSAVLAPNERQGPAMIAWWDSEMGEYAEWTDGPQLFFFTPDGVFGNDDMQVCFDDDYHHYWQEWPSAAGMSVKKIATIEIVPEPREDWNLALSGAIIRTIDRSSFEQGVACTQAGHDATWTDDEGTTWSGMPLWLLCGWVDDADQHAPFRDDLADAGYTVVVIDYGPDGIEGTTDDRTVEFASADVKRNNDIILANKIDDWPLTEGDWPLKLVGAGVPAEKRLGSVDAIRLEGLTGSDDGIVITLQKGWNFVSVPRTLAPGNDTAEIFDGVDSAGHSILTFDAATGLWKTLSTDYTVKPLDGIWIYANQSTGVELTFDPAKPTTPPTKHLTEGWNAIGFSDITSEPATDALVSVKDTWAILIGYDAESQAYEHSAINGAVGTHTDTLPMIPGKGYWLYMRADGTLAAIST